jgi:transmembrane sensor
MSEGKIWNLIAKKLSGEASEEEIHELEVQLKANPDLHYPIQTLMSFWDAAPASNRNETGMALEKHLKRMEGLGIDLNETNHKKEGKSGEKSPQIPSKRGKNWKFLAIGFPCFVLVMAGWVYFLPKFLPPSGFISPALQAKTPSVISTRNGSKTNLVLPDGSQVWLNAGSKLSYDKNYGNTIREITLTGEAFFDVEHNAEKPFIIHTDKMDIKVLGTRFNVKSYPADRTSEASLLRGSIEVSIKDRPGQKIVLKPNEKIVILNGGRDQEPGPASRFATDNPVPHIAIRNLTYQTGGEEIVETSWVENKLIFQDETFKDLAAQMERWYGVLIKFDDPSKEDLRFTGSFKNETIQQALEALLLSAKFNYSIRDNEITIKDK